MDIEPSKFQRKTYNIKAIRVTPDNLKALAEELKADSIEVEKEGLVINLGGLGVMVGDWVVELPGGKFQIYSHEEFVEDYQTHSERGNHDEKYAKIYGLVKAAMVKQDLATYYSQGSAGMDLVAIQTTQKILDEL